jgi:hypothetical protein
MSEEPEPEPEPEPVGLGLAAADDEVDGPETRVELSPTADMEVPERVDKMDKAGLKDVVVDESGVLEELEIKEEQEPDKPRPTTPDTNELRLKKDELGEPEARAETVDLGRPTPEPNDTETRDQPGETGLPKPKARKRKKKGNKKKKKNDKKRAENKNIQKKSQQLVYLLVVFFLAALSLLLCWVASLRLAH